MQVSRHIATFLTLFLFYISAAAQNDSCNLKVSLLTCGPGEDLYSIFGHSALRVKDESKNIDVIFNYGTFDFEDPDFYVKFVRGKLLYFVSAERFGDFIRSYSYENRWVAEQVLTLTCSEKTKLFEALRVNAQEENKYYLYEFLFDNCSTRLIDMVRSSADDSVHVKRIIPSDAPTFRNMLHDYLNRSEKYWSKFGIDLLLGSRIDRKVKNEEAMFLPDYLMKGFDSSLIRGSTLVGSKKTILEADERTANGFSISPLIVTCLLLVGGVLLTTFRNARTIKALLFFDRFLFFVLGVMGCLMMFMWYGTDHELCRNNYNLYWAIPTHLIAAFLVGSNKPIVRKYFTLTAIVTGVFVLSWLFLPQGMNNAFFPLVLLAAIRSLHRALNK